MTIEFKGYYLMLKTFFNNTKRFYNTVKYLKFKQILWRVWYKFHKFSTVGGHYLKTETAPKAWIEHARRKPSLIAALTFEFFGETGSIDELGWDGPNRSKLWRYNQHYFDDLNAKDSKDRIVCHIGLITSWILENSVGNGTGWEPYPTSLRIVNWVKFALSSRELSTEAQASLAVQARWLSNHIEWHILGNHLIANAKALYFCGLFFEGEEAEAWRRNGLAIMLNELQEQILPDGGHFELSPMYHALVVEDFLDIINVAKCYGRSEDVVRLEQVLPSMLAWLKLMSHPDGKISFFNDSATNIAPENSQIFDYAKRLGIQFNHTFDHSILPESGYFRLENSHSVLIGDIGRIGPDYLPSHAHADTLSFEFSLFDQRLVVNSGTSEYGLGPERLRQRGTLAHSTLSINGENSSDVWSGFRVGTRARPGAVTFQTSDTEATVQGSHDGYRVKSGSPVHYRKWSLKPGCLKIEDTISGNSSYNLDVIFRLHPNVSVVQGQKNTLVLTLPSGDTALFKHASGADVVIEATTWHPMFGTTEESSLIRFSKKGKGTIILRFNFTWTYE